MGFDSNLFYPYMQRAAAASALFASLEEKYVGKAKDKKRKVGQCDLTLIKL